MPISKSAKKALRTATNKTSQNRHRKALLKDALKKADASTFSVIDKAAKWGIIHENKAARLKSKIAKELGSTPPSKSEKSSQPATKKAVAKKAPAKKSASKKTAKK